MSYILDIKQAERGYSFCIDAIAVLQNWLCSVYTSSSVHVNIEGILPKGPYLPCVSMAGMALLAGYHRYIDK